jgi:hypothetical protein
MTNKKGAPMPWGYRLLAIGLAILFLGWLVMWWMG